MDGRRPRVRSKRRGKAGKGVDASVALVKGAHANDVHKETLSSIGSPQFKWDEGDQDFMHVCRHHSWMDPRWRLMRACNPHLLREWLTSSLATDTDDGLTRCYCNSACIHPLRYFPTHKGAWDREWQDLCRTRKKIRQNLPTTYTNRRFLDFLNLVLLLLTALHGFACGIHATSSPPFS